MSVNGGRELQKIDHLAELYKLSHDEPKLIFRLLAGFNLSPGTTPIKNFL